MVFIKEYLNWQWNLRYWGVLSWKVALIEKLGLIEVLGLMRYDAFTVIIAYPSQLLSVEITDAGGCKLLLSTL